LLPPVFRNLVASHDFVSAGWRQVRWRSNQETDAALDAGAESSSRTQLLLWISGARPAVPNRRNQAPRATLLQRCFWPCEREFRGFSARGARRFCIASLPSMMSTFFGPIGKEIGDCWGTEHLPVFRGRAFRKAGLPLRSGRHQKDLPRLFLSLSLRGRGFDRPQPNAKALPAYLRLLREQASFARSNWPPQSFGLQEYRRPLSPGPSALLDSWRGHRLPRPPSCPKD